MMALPRVGVEAASRGEAVARRTDLLKHALKPSHRSHRMPTERTPTELHIGEQRLPIVDHPAVGAPRVVEPSLQLVQGDERR